MEVKPRELVAVVGHVGAGKSSLIQALLGEMDKISGSVSLKVCLGHVEVEGRGEGEEGGRGGGRGEERRVRGKKIT